MIGQTDAGPGSWVIVAHGTGPGHDLPIPLFYAVAGGALAVFVSFLAMAVLWPESRLRGADAGRPAVRLGRLVDAAATRWTLRALTFTLTVAVVVIAIARPDDPHENPAASIVYAVFWVGLAVASLLFGPVWRVLNPLRTVHELAARALGRDHRAGRWALPGWLGYWPAAAGLLVFVWMELVSPAPDSTATLLWFFTIYSVVQLAGATAFGAHWFDRCDAFEVYSDLIGRLAPLGRRAATDGARQERRTERDQAARAATDGARHERDPADRADRRLVWRNPLNGLDSLAPAAGLVAVVCVLLASTAFDSVTALWDYGTVAAGTLGLLTAAGIVVALFAGAATAAGAIGQRRGVVPLFAHSLVPIAVGYLIAHYFAYLVGESQRAVVLSLGVDWEINETPFAAGAVAIVQVLAIITGHVLGVVAAHDRAVRLFEPRTAISGQVPMMVLMVIVTITGLVLLAAG